MELQEFRENFGNNIKRIRKEKNLTQSEAAEVVGIEAHNWNRIENGKSFPHIKTLVNIINYFEVLPIQLFMMSGENERLIISIVDILNKNPEKLNDFHNILEALTQKK